MEIQEALIILSVWRNCEKVNTGNCLENLENVFCEKGCWSVDKMQRAIDAVVMALDESEKMIFA